MYRRIIGVFQFDPLWGDRDSSFGDAEADYSRAIRGLRDLAEESAADLVVVGSAHRGKAGQVLAGSVGMSLLHGSPCTVAIAPHGYAARAPDGIAEVTVGFDGSPEARLALTDAKAQAQTPEPAKAGTAA